MHHVPPPPSHHGDASDSGDGPEEDDSSAEAGSKTEDEHKNGGVKTLNLVRGYVLLFFGIGLIIFGVTGPIHPGAMTLGGALVGFNPLFRATVAQ
jgi:hypothetical protein